MIDTAKLRDADIGRWVEYTPSHGETERGKIKSWNDTYIYVVYNCGGEWYRYHNYTACATCPRDLNFIEIKGGSNEIKSK